MNLVFLVTFLRYTCLLVIPLLFVRLVFLSFLVFFCFRAFLLFLFCVFSVFLPFPRSLLIPYFYHSPYQCFPHSISFPIYTLQFPRSSLISHSLAIPNSLSIPHSLPLLPFQHFFVISAYYCCFCILLLFLRTTLSFLRHTTSFLRHSTSFLRHSTSFPRRRESRNKIPQIQKA